MYLHIFHTAHSTQLFTICYLSFNVNSTAKVQKIIYFLGGFIIAEYPPHYLTLYLCFCKVEFTNNYTQVLLITILLHRGEEHQHAYGCQHAAVNLTDGRSDESADDEQEAGEEGDVKRRTVRRQMRLRALTDKSDTST